MKRYYFERTGEKKKNFVCGVVNKISEEVEYPNKGALHPYTFFEAGGPGSFRRGEGSFPWQTFRSTLKSKRRRPLRTRIPKVSRGRTCEFRRRESCP